MNHLELSRKVARDIITANPNKFEVHEAQTGKHVYWDSWDYVLLSGSQPLEHGTGDKDEYAIEIEDIDAITVGINVYYLTSRHQVGHFAATDIDAIITAVEETHIKAANQFLKA